MGVGRRARDQGRCARRVCVHEAARRELKCGEGHLAVGPERKVRDGDGDL